MSTTYVVTTEPATEPVTLDDLKTALRILSCDFDSQLTLILKQARKQVEEDARRKLITQTVKLYMDEFPDDDEIEIRLAPIQSITSVKYYDQNATLQTLATTVYWENLIETPPEIELRQSQIWPVVQLERPNAVIIEFVAGYGSTAASVPAAARLAIMEYAKSIWSGCEVKTDTYNRLVSSIAWTGYHEVEC